METRDPTTRIARLTRLRHELHAFPEVSGQEVGTAACLREFLVPCNPARLLENLGGHGLAAVFDSPARDAGPTVVLRAELDALPIHETGTHDHPSQRRGAAHACGHDGHMAMLCGVALGLRERPLRRGRLALLFQPAEETGEGARRVVAEPRWQGLAADYVFAVHNLPGYPLGQVMLRAGPLCAGSVGLVIRLEGRTSHAAYPEQGHSPAAALSRLLTELVALPVALERDDALALVTVVHARLGEVAFGTSPGEAEIMATLRSDDEAVLGELRKRAVALARAAAEDDGLGCALEWVDEFPVTRNDDLAVAVAGRAARSAGLAIAEPVESPFRWSEDFGWFTRQATGAIVGLGSGEHQSVLHAADFDFPDALLPMGLRFWDALIDDLGLR
jgi:amidohydrolase